MKGVQLLKTLLQQFPMRARMWLYLSIWVPDVNGTFLIDVTILPMDQEVPAVAVS